MRYLLFIPLLFLAGCSSLPPWLGGVKNLIETQVGANVSGIYKINVEKDGKVLYTETWECTKDAAGKLTGCHKQSATPAAPAVTPK